MTEPAYNQLGLQQAARGAYGEEVLPDNAFSSSELSVVC